MGVPNWVSDGLLNSKKYYFFSFWGICLFKLLHNVDTMNCTWTNQLNSDRFKDVNVEVEWLTSVKLLETRQFRDRWYEKKNNTPTLQSLIDCILFCVRFQNIILIGSYPYPAALARIWNLCLYDLLWRTAPQQYPAVHQGIESRILNSRLQF